MNSELWRQAEKVSDILYVLANPMRLVIVCLLLKKERCATELLEMAGTTKGNISQHLKLLLLKNLIRRRRDGHRIYYSISDAHLKTIIQCLSDCYCCGHEETLY